MGNEESTLLWDDSWHAGRILKDIFPRVYALKTIKSITVGGNLTHPSIFHSFCRMPRGGVEQSQFSKFSDIMHQVNVSSVRKLIDDSVCSSGDHVTSWIRYVPNKVKIHAWKVMTNSLATKFNISKRGININSISCEICGIGVETTSHLFFTCDMAQQVSRLINHWWDVSNMEADSYDSWKTWVDNIRMTSKTKMMFVGVYHVMWWLLWWYRNLKIFEAKAPNKAMFFDDVISKSFYWCQSRSKASFSWND